MDLSKLSPISRSFAARLFREVPEAEGYARAEGDEPADLLVEIPSPTNHPRRSLLLWMESRVEPSLAFGGWHTHADLLERDEEIIDMARAILDDQLVLVLDLGGEDTGFAGVVDLREEDALLEELTSEHSPGRVRLETWSGQGDREVGLQDLE